MRYFYLFCLSLLSMTSFGSHLLGGSISWKCVGNNQYVFYLDVYRDCWLGSATYIPNTIKGPQGNITVNSFAVEYVSARCYGQAAACTAPVAASGSVELTRLKSSIITLPGAPPPAGWEFSWEQCCRDVNLVNVPSPSNWHYIKSIMYPGNSSGCNSSPYFTSNPIGPISRQNKSVSAFARSDNPSDSLYYRFSHPFISTSAHFTFSSGYSFTTPFPNSTTNTSNGPISINPSNGLIEMDVQAGTDGLYTYAVVVEQWRDNVLLSEISRDIVVDGKFSSITNSAPILEIDTSLYDIQRNGRVYTIKAFVGDTVQFQLDGSDNDFNSTSNAQQVIKFSAAGYALDTIWGGNSSYQDIAVLTPVAPQSAFSNTFTNKVKFVWPVGQEHLSGDGTTHFFHFQLSDDNCPSVGISNIMVEISVEKAVDISPDSIWMCEGDSVQISGYTASGIYSWSPSNHLSSPTSASPYVYPISSQYYYLNDPQNPNFKDSVFIDVTPTGFFNLAFNSGQLLLTDSVQTTTRVWFYNGIPFAYPYDTLTPFGLGDYYAIGKAGACEFLSDTVAIDTGMSFAVSSTGNGAYSGSPVLFTGSLGTTVQVSQSVYITSVAIAGISDLYGKTGGYDLKLQVYDDMQNQVFLRDTTLTKPIEGLVILPINNLKLKANTDYTFSVSGDTGYAFSVFENVSLPATPHNGGLTVKAISEGNHGQFPSGSTNYMLPLTMGINRGIGISETHQQSFDIFPNPASSEFAISGFADVNTIELLDVNGKMIRSFLVKKNQKELKIEKARLPAGLYFVKVHSGNTTSVKKVLFQ